MKVAINGFGRIGRAVFRILRERGIKVVAINDLNSSEDCAYLLKYDSVYGRFDESIRHDKHNLIIGKDRIKVLNESNPEHLPWKELGADIVVESTGVFANKEGGEMHLRAGAKKILITAPCDVDTVVLGVNDSILTKSTNIYSIASCTTNCLAPIVKIINDAFGIKHALFTTTHGYTASQSIVDGFHKKKRRGRAGAVNLIPTSTGANKATTKVIPELEGKIEGIAIRAPVVTGSITDVIAEVKKKVDIERVNSVLKKISKTKMKGIVDYTEDEIVSTDIIRNTNSAVVDGLSTKVNGDLVKVMAWYDNEWGYSNRVADVIERLKRFL